jgi:hypothetical protein
VLSPVVVSPVVVSSPVVVVLLAAAVEELVGWSPVLLSGPALVPAGSVVVGALAPELASPLESGVTVTAAVSLPLSSLSPSLQPASASVASSRAAAVRADGAGRVEARAMPRR